jgi:CelD/BcsL family acetyltransferase involved in cellulose biosynthesis
MNNEVITNWQTLEPLKDEWDQLLQSSSGNSIFLTWDWIQAWRSVTGEDISLFIITVRDNDDRLVGIAPFYQYRIKLFKSIQFKALRILADYATGAEYPDLIVSPDCEDDALASIADTLLEQGHHWDLIWAPDISGWNGARERFYKIIQHAGMLHHMRPTSFSSFALPETFELYEKSFSSKRRKNLRRSRRNLFNQPGMEAIYCQDTSELSRFTDALFDLHHKRRMLLDDPGAFIRKPLMADFYRQFLPVALKKGWLRFFALTKDDTIEAIQIGYAYNGEYLAVQEGYNPDFYDGAGNVLRHISIENSIVEGLKTYDFLGGFTEHKKLWKAEERLGCDIFIGRPNLKNKLLFLKEIWPTGRFASEHGLYDGN